MLTVPVNQAKDKFSALLQAAEGGEEVIITRHGKRVARLVKAPDEESPALSLQARKQAAIARLEALHQSINPASSGKKASWQALRDMGRKY